MELLGILGRGIQRLTPNGPWVLTENLEVCDEKGAHLPVRAPADDSNPRCLIGGGELNLLAGLELCKDYRKKLQVVVCAYGQRSPYLQSINAPSESEVMSEWLTIQLIGKDKPEILVWLRDRVVDGPSNTNRELQNILELAVERGFTKVGVVTVAVHYARALLMAQRHLVKPEFSHLELQFFASEDVVLKADPKAYRPRIVAMHRSDAFMRNFSREINGINCLLAGRY